MLQVIERLHLLRNFSERLKDCDYDLMMEWLPYNIIIDVYKLEMLPPDNTFQSIHMTSINFNGNYNHGNVTE